MPLCTFGDSRSTSEMKYKYKRKRNRNDIDVIATSPSPQLNIVIFAIILTVLLLPDVSLSLSISRHAIIHPCTGSDQYTYISYAQCKRYRSNHERSLTLYASTENNNEDEDDIDKSSMKKVGSSKDNKDANSKANKKPKQPNILQMINPFEAGKNLRSQVESAIDLVAATNDPASRLPPDRRSIYYNYYVDDQLGLSSMELKDSKYDESTSTLSSSDDDYRPEVLVVGSTGALGSVLVKRLLLEGNVRVRVLVRDLYSSTLNKLGTGVVYCQGSLSDMESLEYALTDVDKIVFCAGGNSDKKGEDSQAIDGVGLRNLLHAYQNVRHADYGLSQTAKRTLFKFSKRPEDFSLFGIDGDGNIDDPIDYRYSQCDWIQNKFNHGTFVGNVGRYGEAAISSSRLKSRSDPNGGGIDLFSKGFAGFVCRVCSDGAVYEAFIRTEAYETLGIEYVCEFKTSSKLPSSGDNSSRTKWSTVRLEFTSFLPRMRQFQSEETLDARRMRKALGKTDIPNFTGKDIRTIGFRYRGKSNIGRSKFYLALDYIKVYRRPDSAEPEIVYMSDSRIPPVVNDAMIQHNQHRLITSTSQSSLTSSHSDTIYMNESKIDRTEEETYFKYMGEEMIKQSGLSYTIIRVAGYNTDLGTDSSVVRLQKVRSVILYSLLWKITRS